MKWMPPICKERNETLLFAGNITFWVESSKESTKVEILKLINNFSKDLQYKIITSLADSIQ